ncbi:uncharacterized protein B0H18DRAFT_85523 [Fomitopsis serialis]|uniref:uncharacterized protein n=1 Tax=Fomitopsis serialis TaxID=139415 RepID=UPI00200734D1|nr:uncharacterized protein B0H18DRAFT_85523 [Neoantrodia serialis]KAH9931485.1 hypothetical protein B0H18DRAFT_85523 [Neoantrodia serialis]
MLQAIGNMLATIGMDGLTGHRAEGDICHQAHDRRLGGRKDTARRRDCLKDGIDEHRVVSDGDDSDCRTMGFGSTYRLTALTGPRGGIHGLSLLYVFERIERRRRARTVCSLWVAQASACSRDKGNLPAELASPEHAPLRAYWPQLSRGKRTVGHGPLWSLAGGCGQRIAHWPISLNPTIIEQDDDSSTNVCHPDGSPSTY